MPFPGRLSGSLRYPGKSDSPPFGPRSSPPLNSSYLNSHQAGMSILTPRIDCPHTPTYFGSLIHINSVLRASCFVSPFPHATSTYKCTLPIDACTSRPVGEPGEWTERPTKSHWVAVTAPPYSVLTTNEIIFDTADTEAAKAA